MDTKFTPGQWEVYTNTAGAIEVKPHGASCGVRDNGEYLCVSISTEGEDCTRNDKTKANAHLIAAAPELYEALQELERTVRKMGLDVSKASTVLAKARGES